jgi:diguanylate cyclase (GGDEF)-like protein
MILVALLTAAAAGSGILGLNDYADERSEAQLRLRDIEAEAHQQSALEWEAVAERGLTSEIADDLRTVQDQMAASMTALARLDGGSQQVREVRAAMDVYQAAVADEFDLLAHGELAVAEEVDEQRVDPAFDRLTETLEETSVGYGTAARGATRTADLGTILLLVVAASVIGLLVWRFHRARRRAAESLAHQALHDPLTGLPNRALIAERLQTALARASRRQEPVLLMYLDLDDFKVVNDSLGHRAGDQLLLEVGRRLQACLRPGDTAARMGGDEFTVLLADVTRLDEAISVAKRLGKELQAPMQLDGHRVVVNASIGIASSTEGGDAADDLLRSADIAMYEAKKQGKGRHQVFAPDMDQRARDRLDLEADLRAALDRNEFELHYQPILDLETGAITQLEALVRWNHPRRGMLPPADFIALAEQTGLIVPLGAWILTQACRQVAAWHDRHQLPRAIEVSVNLSARQLRQPDLVARVTQTLTQTGLRPHQLRLEITESSMVHDPNSAVATLQSLRDLGVHLAVDDFGTGFATLSSLKRLPVDCLKIDRSFVAGLGQDAQDTAIVHAVIAFAKMLGLRVTGEGIETAGQFEQLRALGCDYGQGYYFARPLPGDGVESLLAGSKQPTHHPADQPGSLPPPPGRQRGHVERG